MLSIRSPYSPICPAPRVDLSVRRTTILNHIDSFGAFLASRARSSSKRVPPGSTTSEEAKHEEEDCESTARPVRRGRPSSGADSKIAGAVGDVEATVVGLDLNEGLGDIERVTKSMVDAAQFYALPARRVLQMEISRLSRSAARARKYLAWHVRDGTMDRVERARRNLVSRGEVSKGASISMLMGRNGGVHGLAVAGASGLLALVYPEEFGTVDVKLTQALQQVGLPQVMRINPRAITGS